MDKLIEAMQAMGISVNDDMDDAQIQKVAKAVGLEPLDYLEREVKIIPYTNKRKETNTFVETPPFVVGTKADGKSATVRGLFLRVEALDQCIEDLLSARELLTKKG